MKIRPREDSPSVYGFYGTIKRGGNWARETGEGKEYCFYITRNVVVGGNDNLRRPRRRTCQRKGRIYCTGEEEQVEVEEEMLISFSVPPPPLSD